LTVHRDTDGIEKLLLKTQVSEKFLHSEVNLLIQYTKIHVITTILFRLSFNITLARVVISFLNIYSTFISIYNSLIYALIKFIIIFGNLLDCFFSS
jgi:hypothetical protein